MSNETCFVIMPFGVKKDVHGNAIDFDKVYTDLIGKAVEKIPGLDVIRCDDIALPGWVHKRMIEHIQADRVAIVDTSLLNANVFYELGVRHALRKAVTVLIHRQGTEWPFNIAGLSSIEYGDSLVARRKAGKLIKAYIENALASPENVDSLVHNIIPGLRVVVGPARDPKEIKRKGLHLYALNKLSGKKIGFATGDYAELDVGEARVTSENTNMQMDSFFGRSTSATVRFLGAKKHRVTGRVTEDTLADLLAMEMDGEANVEPGTVVVTRSGALEAKGVKWIFHAASVKGQYRRGYRPIEKIEQCVTNALRKADSDQVADDPPRTILFPIFGTGPAGGDLRDHLQRFLSAAINYLETQPDSQVDEVYFYAWSDMDLEACHEVAGALEALALEAAADGE